MVTGDSVISTAGVSSIDGLPPGSFQATVTASGGDTNQFFVSCEGNPPAPEALSTLRVPPHPLETPTAGGAGSSSTCPADREEAKKAPKATIPPAPTPTPRCPSNFDSKQSAEWFENTFHQGSAPSPLGKMKELQVVSWMQVPHILAKLQNADQQIRVSFPEVTPEDPNIKAEQEKIRQFLVECAGDEMKNISAKVAAEIEKCQVFKNKQADFKAADYVAHFKLSDTNGDQLTVAEVIRTDASFVPTKAGAPRKGRAIAERDVILRAIEKAMDYPAPTEFRSIVVEVPTKHDRVARETLGARFRDVSDTSRVKVWVSGFEGHAAKVEEFDLLTYMGGALHGGIAPLIAGKK